GAPQLAVRRAPGDPVVALALAAALDGAPARPDAMKILILAEYIEAAPWSESRWAVDLSRALVARGHEVTLACDSTHDEEAAAPATLLVRRRRRRQRERHPLRFVRWAGRLRRTLPHDVSLSLSRLVAADARLPIG